MSEEKIGGGTGAFQLVLMIGIVAGIVLLVVALWFTLFSFVPAPKLVNETNITIEHLWEDGGKYYFSDNEGFVYEMEDKRAFGGQVMYDALAKTRFAKLKEGVQYQVEYCCDWDVRILISETEIEK